MKYLLDTNICIFLLRGKYGLSEAIDRVGFQNCCISEITKAELMLGIELAIQRGRQVPVRETMAFINSINCIPISGVIKDFAAEKARLMGLNSVIEDFDLLIGMTAVVEGMTMVTDNVRHLGRIIGIILENWTGRD